VKIAVSHDEQGNIVVAFDPEKMGNDKGTLKYFPAEGERHYVLEIPKGFEGRSIMELAESLRVDLSGGEPRLEPKV
jgi:hypothetical protein